MNKKLLILLLTLAMAFVFAGCGSSGEEATDEGSGDQTQVLVFAAASMQSSLEELEAAFEAENPDIDIVLNCDSSGTLMTQPPAMSSSAQRRHRWMSWKASAWWWTALVRTC